MFADPVRLLVLAGAIGAGLVAGVLFAFSSFVMPALRRLPAPAGIAAMQAVNRAAVTPVFMAVLFGTAAVGLAVGVAAAVRPDRPGTPYQLAGAVLYLATIGLTAGYHVPRNNALAALDPDAAGASRQWDRYHTGWTRWNHLRTGTALAGAVLLTLALRFG